MRPAGRSRWLNTRRIVQLLMLALFVGLIASTSWTLPPAPPVDTFARIDPLLSISSAIAGRTWIPALLTGLLVLLLTLVLGRFFCGWVCPLGTCLELGDDLLGAPKKRRWLNHERRLRGVKYAVLIAVLVGALLGQGLVYLADPIVWVTRLFTYALWPLVAALGNTSLDALRPVLDSMGFVELARADLMQPTFGWAGVLALGFLVLMLALGLRYQRRFWCRTLCPLGALLAIPARFSLFHRRVGGGCRGEGRCRRACETGAVHRAGASYDPGECIQCGACSEVCRLADSAMVPQLAWRREGRQPAIDLGRRGALAALGSGALVGAWVALSPGRAAASHDVLRPPGALPQDDFLATCVRCGQCAKACPTHCLQPAAFESGIAGLLAPQAIMRLGGCDQNCNACGQVCPTAAIRPLDLVEKNHARIGTAVLDRRRCVVWEEDKLCLVCDENCPYGAIEWEANERGVRVPHVDESRCNGCGHCEYACPVDGISAIRVVPNGEIRLADGSYQAEAQIRGLQLNRSKPTYW